MEKTKSMLLIILILSLGALLMCGVACAEGEATYALSVSVPEHCQQLRLTLESTGEFVDSTGGTMTLESVKAGDTVNVRIIPKKDWKVDSLSYTYRIGGIALPYPLAFTEDEEHIAQGSFTMPNKDITLQVNLSAYCLTYISYDSQGNCLGEDECTNFTQINSGEQNWIDINEDNGGWYAVMGNAMLSSHTTIRVTGDVHLILCDGATLTVGDGIYIKRGSSLSIYGQSEGTGKLIAKPESGPGICGMADTVGGSLYIHGGVIDAKGGTNAAGIGGGNHSSGYENIVIYGGDVTAQGGSSGAGIGKGQQNSPSDCGQIAIYGGTVHATGGRYGAGIGGGEDRDGGNIAIYGGKVTTDGGHDGAGIGGGEGGSGGNILIAGGTVIATGGPQGAGIGGGEDGNGGTIVIRDGNVTAKPGYQAAGIGGGERGNGGSITIHGGTVNATGSKQEEDIFGALGIEGGAAIGGGRGANAGTILINGGEVTADATGSYMGAAGIGVGVEGTSGRITIGGGTVIAKGNSGAAIGGGYSKKFDGNITITGGKVEAYGDEGAAIGGGYGGSLYGKVLISGGEVYAHSGDGGAGIGGGKDPSGLQNATECFATIEITGGTITAIGIGGETQAIGYGYYTGNEGTLSLGDSMMVTAGSETSGSNAARCESSKRVSGCRSHYVKIEVCNEHKASGTFDITADTHASRCAYCNAQLDENTHLYKDGICTVCGYAGTAVTVVYAPGNTHATGEMAAESYIPNSTHLIANCGYTVDGYEFVGWRLDDTDTILPSGMEYEFDSNLTLTATWHNAWSELQAEIDAAESGAEIRLEEDTFASIYDSALKIAAGKAITLNLNGCTLDRGLTKLELAGQVIVNNGTLTITDSAGGGIITGGRNFRFGGGIVNNGTLTIEGGSIDGNAASEGGAVYNAKNAVMNISGGALSHNRAESYSGGAIANSGSLTITGGIISENTSNAYGAGIWSEATLNLYGGTITGNSSAQNGCGIYCSEGTLSLSGAPVVSGNSVRNLYLKKGVAVQMAGALEEGLRIGISCDNYPTEADGLKVIATGITSYAGGFVCDDDSYIAVVTGEGEMQIITKPEFGTPDLILPSDLIAIEANAFEGTAAAVVDIPDGCASIGDYAFKGCSNLSRIRIPKGCALGTDVFDGCAKVFIFGAEGSQAEAYCNDPAHSNCVFIPVE